MSDDTSRATAEPQPVQVHTPDDVENDKIEWCDTSKLLAGVSKTGFTDEGKPYFAKTFPKHRNLADSNRLQVATLGFLLNARWNCSAYFTLYVPPPDKEYWYRLSEGVFDVPGALDKIGGAVRVQLFMVDCDAPEHGANGPEAVNAWFETERPKLEKLREKHGCLVYRSKNGYRILAPLKRPLELKSRKQVIQYKHTYMAWLCYLVDVFDLGTTSPIDELTDWQRLQRVPFDLRREDDKHEPREILGDTGKIGYWQPPLKESYHEWADEQLKARKIGFKGKVHKEVVYTPHTGATVLRTLLQSHGLLGDEIEKGKWQVICPAESMHSAANTTVADSDTCLWENGGKLGYLYCSHAGCGHNRWSHEDWLRQFPDDEVEAARKAVGVGAAAAASKREAEYHISNPSDWCAIAEVVVKHLPRTVWWREEIWQWTGSYFDKVSSKDFAKQVRRISKQCWYTDAEREDGDETTSPFLTSTRSDTEIIAALAARPGVTLKDDLEPPFWIDRPEDAKQEPSQLVFYKNGRVNYYTGREHEELDDRIFHTWCLQTEKQWCISRRLLGLEWQKFLESIWPGDAKSKLGLQEWMGCVLTGYTAHQKIFYFQGVRRSGKGTILRILQKLMGPLAARSISSRIGGRFDLEDIAHTPFAYCPDAVWSNAKDASDTMERLLQGSGGDDLRTDCKNKGRKLVCRKNWWIASNHMLKMKDLSNAMKGRLQYLRTEVSFFGKEDLDLEKRLTAELEPIAFWALQGLMRLLANKGQFTRPEYFEEAMIELENACNPPSKFFGEYLAVGGYVTCRELREAYSSFAKEEGTGTYSEENLGKVLRTFCQEKGWAIKNGEKRISGKKQRVYLGIKLKGQEQTLSVSLLRAISNWVKAPMKWEWSDEGRKVKKPWDGDTFHIGDVLTHGLDVPIAQQPGMEDNILRHLANLGHVPDEDGLMPFGSDRSRPTPLPTDEEVDEMFANI